MRAMDNLAHVTSPLLKNADFKYSWKDSLRKKKRASALLLQAGDSSQL